MTLERYIHTMEFSRIPFYSELNEDEKKLLLEDTIKNIHHGVKFRTKKGSEYIITSVYTPERTFTAESFGFNYTFTFLWFVQSVLDGRTKILSTLLNNKAENDGKEILRTETERTEHSSISGRAVKTESSASILTVGSGLNCYKAKGISLRS